MTGSDETADPRATGGLRRLIDAPWYPLLFAAAWVLNLWVETGVSALAVARSLLIVVLGVCAILLVATLASRRPHVAAAITITAFGLLVSRSLYQAAAVVLLGVTVPLAAWYWARIRHRPFSLQGLTHALNAFCALLIGLVIAGGIGPGTLASVPRDLAQSDMASDAGLPATGDTPDIVMLLLDGYPRADRYEEIFRGDNSAFLESLEARGFSIATESTSNYMFTQLTLASMFHMRPVPEIPELEPVFDGSMHGHPRLRNTINDNPVFDLLRDRGYRITTFGPGYEHVALRQADVYIDGGQLNDFEYELLRSTPIENILLRLDPGFHAEQKRARVRDGFDAFAAAAANDGRSTFSFIHLPAPHLPVVFAEDGGAAPLPPSGDIHGRGDEDQLPAAAYRAQLDYLNARVLDVIDSSFSQRPTEDQPILIIMSDHGAERRPQVFESDGTPGHYANLFAYRTPGAADVFPPDHSPINTFPRLFNAYFGMSIDEWPDSRYPWIASP